MKKTCCRIALPLVLSVLFTLCLGCSSKSDLPERPAQNADTAAESPSTAVHPDEMISESIQQNEASNENALVGIWLYEDWDESLYGERYLEHSTEIQFRSDGSLVCHEKYFDFANDEELNELYDPSKGSYGEYDEAFNYVLDGNLLTFTFPDTDGASDPYAIFIASFSLEGSLVLCECFPESSGSRNLTDFSDEEIQNMLEEGALEMTRIFRRIG